MSPNTHCMLGDIRYNKKIRLPFQVSCITSLSTWSGVADPKVFLSVLTPKLGGEGRSGQTFAAWMPSKRPSSTAPIHDTKARLWTFVMDPIPITLQ
jgi:hypothetical protein